jgi:hypothetical protein
MSRSGTRPSVVFLLGVIMFKLDDKVKCIKDNIFGYIHGKIYTVSASTYNSELIIKDSNGIQRMANHPLITPLFRIINREHSYITKQAKNAPET